MTSCETLGNPNCGGTIKAPPVLIHADAHLHLVTITCSANFEGNTDSTAPAAYVIFNSIIGLHNMFEDVHEGVRDALSPALGKIGTFVETVSEVLCFVLSHVLTITSVESNRGR